MVSIYIKAPIIFLTTYFGCLFILPKLIHIASTYAITSNGASAEKFSLMDQPDNNRKVHKRPKPLVGGLGMLAVVSFSSILFVPPGDLNLRGYYSAVIILGIVGFLDDFKELNYRWKFVAHIFAALIMIHYSKTALLSFGDVLSFGAIQIGIFFAPVTIFCTIGVINAINMIDGLDGLAGGISLISFISFSVLAYINCQYNMMLLSIAIIGAILGFLKYNWHPSKLFMGDAGSFFLGFSLAFFAIFITQKNGSIVPPVSALLILAVPIVDTLTVMVRRLIKGKNPFSADQIHFHHILLSLGLSVKQVVLIILFISLLFSILGVAGTVYGINEHHLFFVFFSYLVLYFFASFFAKKT